MSYEKLLKIFFAALAFWLIKLTETLINAYKIFFSPWLGNRCRFTPSCSEYALQSLKHHGFLLGLCKTTLRVLCCHPFHPGGYDPVLK